VIGRETTTVCKFYEICRYTVWAKCSILGFKQAVVHVITTRF
jgi:hypothetical protein